MWWARSEVGDVYLSGGSLALRVGREPAQRRGVEQGDWKLALNEALAEHPGLRWRVWLGGRLCALHGVEPIEGIRQIEEAEAAVAALVSSEGAPVEARLAVWSASDARTWIAACLPAGLPGECEQVVRSHGGRLASLRPWWVAAPSVLGASAAVCDDEAIHYWRSDERGHVDAGSFFVPEAARPAALQRLQVAGPLPGWRLDLAGPVAGRQAGFLIQPLSEGADAATRPAV